MQGVALGLRAPGENSTRTRTPPSLCPYSNGMFDAHYFLILLPVALVKHSDKKQFKEKGLILTQLKVQSIHQWWGIRVAQA